MNKRAAAQVKCNHSLEQIDTRRDGDVAEVLGKGIAIGRVFAYAQTLKV